MEFETCEKHLHGCVGGPWLYRPSSQEREWVGNGDLEVVSVDMGIEAIGTDGASWEGTRLEKNRGQGQALENGELGAEEPKEAWIGEPTFFPQHPVPSFLAQILTVPHCPAHQSPSSPSPYLIYFLLASCLMYWRLFNPHGTSCVPYL